MESISSSQLNSLLQICACSCTEFTKLLIKKALNVSFAQGDIGFVDVKIFESKINDRIPDEIFLKVDVQLIDRVDDIVKFISELKREDGESLFGYIDVAIENYRNVEIR